MDLTHGFDDDRFSDMFPNVCQIRGARNQLFLKCYGNEICHIFVFEKGEHDFQNEFVILYVFF